jgi:hypothetical protein
VSTAHSSPKLVLGHYGHLKEGDNLVTHKVTEAQEKPFLV